MKTIFQSSVAILLSGSALLGCVKLPETPKTETKKLEFKFDPGLPEARPVPHTKGECPALEGVYETTEIVKGDEVTKRMSFDRTSGELLISVGDSILEENVSTYAVVGKLINVAKKEDYSAGCKDGKVLIQTSIAGIVFSTTTISADEDLVYVSNNSLGTIDDSVTVWHKQNKAQEQ